MKSSTSLRSLSLFGWCFALFLVLISSSLVVAEVSESEFAACAALDGDLERLECFDTLAKKNNLDSSQSLPSPTDGVGKWHVSIDVNPIDDSKTVTMLLLADSGQNRFGEKVALFARCSSRSTDFWINWNDYLGNDNPWVLSRIGSHEAETKPWNQSTNNQATFHRNPVEFLKAMLLANKFVAQVTPYNENPTTAIFISFFI